MSENNFVKLGDVAHECRLTWSGGQTDIPIVGLEHLVPGEIELSSWDSNIEHTFSKKFLKGQVLLGRRRVYLKKAVVAPCDGICSGDITVIESTGGILPELLPFVIQNDRFFDYAMQGSAGSLSPRVKWEHLKNYEFSLPPLAEQKVLADKLWAAYRLKESYKKLLAATEEMVKSQFIEMFDFHELNFNSPSKDFESICLDDTSSATKIPAAEYLQEGKYAVYDQAQEKDIAGYSNTEQGLCRNYPAVLFGDHSRVVKYINEPFFIGADGVKIIRPRKDNLIPEFLYYDLKYHNIPNTGYNRHFKYIKMISLTKASLEEQSQFLSIAHQADKSGFELRKSIEAIDQVIKSLINS